MKVRFTQYLSICLLLLLNSCQNQVADTAADPAEIIEQVTRQVDAFHAADTSLNAQGVVDLLWPEFTMLADGNRVSYAEVKTGSQTFMASLTTFHTEWEDLKITPLGNRHAISSFIFTDSIVAKDGTLTHSRGPNTFVWEKRAEVWKVIYADADHYPK
ncbi:MAG: nuclear transport factor 2 family protein [Saprospiraceae bacterium]|nr:nuclear transport factor 2 family protein [Saprospiraceae bacterium]